MRSEIMKVKKKYVSLYNQYFSCERLLSYQSTMRLKAMFNAAGESIANSEQALATDRVELVICSIRFADLQLDLAGQKLQQETHRPVV